MNRSHGRESSSLDRSPGCSVARDTVADERRETRRERRGERGIEGEEKKDTGATNPNRILNGWHNVSLKLCWNRSNSVTARLAESCAAL